jgi:glucuronoarabinoxylan endo-1,4-beta-xylanase
VGVCAPIDDSRAVVTIDLDEKFQTLVGFGSSLAYGENEIAAHSQADALYDALFLESGIDVIRLGNRFEPDLEEELEITGQIIAGAEERMVNAPILLMTAGSPPGELKANGSRRCSGDAATCTLATVTPGVFDYVGFADHWRTSLDAYAAVGVIPDYLSIQNNPDWLPPESAAYDACRFLPQEGTTTVIVDGAELEVTYPGYDEALSQVTDALVGLSNVPVLVAPEASTLSALLDYSSSIRSGVVGAVACHLYEQDPRSSDSAPFSDVKDLAESEELPVFQSEMQADGMDTALLIHRAMTEANAAMYLQNDFVVSESSLEGNPHGLVQLTADGFETQGPYHAIAHYALRTDPGWRRVQADTNTADLRVSAWQDPMGDALTIVLVNPGAEAVPVDHYLDELRSRLTSSEVTLTIFSGNEELSIQGELSASNTLNVPADAIITVALWE